MRAIRDMAADMRLVLLSLLWVLIAAGLTMITVRSSTMTSSVTLPAERTRPQVEAVLQAPVSPVLIIPIVLVIVASLWPGDRQSARTVRFVTALLLACFAVISAASIGLLFLPAALLMYAAARTWKAPIR